MHDFEIEILLNLLIKLNICEIIENILLVYKRLNIKLNKPRRVIQIIVSSSDKFL